MKKRLIVSILMVLLLGTISLAQTIYSPSNGEVIEIPAGPATTTNVCISYNNGGGNTSGNYCYRIYLNGSLCIDETLNSPICLSLSPGTYTVMVEYCYNPNPNPKPNSNSVWIVMNFSSVTFTVVKVPTITVTASTPSIAPGESVTFCATCDIPYHPKDFEWNVNLFGGWVTDVGSGNCTTLKGTYSGQTIIAKVYMLFNGRKIYSYGVGVPVR